MTRSGKRTNFLETLLEAQRLAFAPFIFKALSAALESGLLAAVERSEGGADLETMARETNLSPYAAQLLLDILSTVSIVERTETGWRTTEKGDLFLFDDLTRANFDFTDRVNFAGLEHTLEALREGRPAGLQVFNADWETIYPHLPELPEDARRAWFRFDHFHSDRAYEAAQKKRAGTTVLESSALAHVISDVRIALKGKGVENPLFHAIKLTEGDELEVKAHPDEMQMVEEFKKQFADEMLE